MYCLGFVFGLLLAPKVGIFSSLRVWVRVFPTLIFSFGSLILLTPAKLYRALIAFVFISTIEWSRNKLFAFSLRLGDMSDWRVGLSSSGSSVSAIVVYRSVVFVTRGVGRFLVGEGDYDARLFLIITSFSKLSGTEYFKLLSPVLIIWLRA